MSGATVSSKNPTTVPGRIACDDIPYSLREIGRAGAGQGTCPPANGCPVRATGRGTRPQRRGIARRRRPGRGHRRAVGTRGAPTVRRTAPGHRGLCRPSRRPASGNAPVLRPDAVPHTTRGAVLQRQSDSAVLAARGPRGTGQRIAASRTCGRVARGPGRRPSQRIRAEHLQRPRGTRAGRASRDRRSTFGGRRDCHADDGPDPTRSVHDNRDRPGQAHTVRDPTTAR